MSPKFTAQDRYYMGRALQLAQKGSGLVSPNPMVGAVIVRQGKMVTQGYHRRFGADHAEIAALKRAGKNSRAATLYVNLEPCCHQGKTPPCTEAIIKAGLKTVCIGMVDPNPLVSGKGIRRLRQAGLKVKSGLLNGPCRQLNEAFVTYHTKRRPFIIVKWAMTADGRTSTDSGESKWISSADSRALVQKVRSQADAILVGSGTVVKDNPLLTVRLKNYKGKPPLRILIDKELEIPLGSKCLDTRDAPTLILTASTNSKKKKALKNKGVEILTNDCKKGNLDFNQLMHYLWEMQIQSILVEGGRRLCGSLFAQGLVDKLLIFIAPKIVGGQLNTAPLINQGVKSINDAISLTRITIQTIGKDLMIQGYPKILGQVEQ